MSTLVNLLIAAVLSVLGQDVAQNVSEISTQNVIECIQQTEQTALTIYPLDAAKFEMKEI